MSVISPSKHLSLKFLLAIKDDYYRSGDKEYVAEEVDALIYEKMGNIDTDKELLAYDNSRGPQ